MLNSIYLQVFSAVFVIENNMTFGRLLEKRAQATTLSKVCLNISIQREVDLFFYVDVQERIYDFFEGGGGGADFNYNLKYEYTKIIFEDFSVIGFNLTTQRCFCGSEWH